MNQFTFEAKHKQVLIGFMILGVLCMLGTFIGGGEDHHMRFWSNLLHNSVFFTGIAFVSLFVLTAFTTAYTGWHITMKRVWEAFSQFLIPGLVLMLIIIIGLWGGLHHLYHWADGVSVAADEVLQHKASFLNKGWYTFGTLIIVGTWIFFARKLRQLSIDEDNNGTTEYAQYKKIKVYSAIFLPIAAFSSAAIIWQWVMSVDAHWYSTMFAWYTTASWFVSAMALTILLLIFLKSQGYYENVTTEHLHDIGKYMFAFSIFWTYLWFSQYMLIWYANVGEETVYFQKRLDEFPVLFYGNLIMNFFLPFLILMRNSTKRKYGTLVFVSILVLFGHWWDFFQMIKPGTLHTAHELAAHGGGHGHEAVEHAAHFTVGFSIPGLLELGTMLGFLAFFIFMALNQLTKANLEPKNDPYYEESLHHHVQ